jgi:hypothetical protein
MFLAKYKLDLYIMFSIILISKVFIQFYMRTSASISANISCKVLRYKKSGLVDICWYL